MESLIRVYMVSTTRGREIGNSFEVEGVMT